MTTPAPDNNQDRVSAECPSPSFKLATERLSMLMADGMKPVREAFEIGNGKVRPS